MNKSIYIIILFYFVPFLVKGYSLPPLKNYGTCKDVYNDSITNEYTIISKKDASVVWYRAVNASDTIVVLSLKSKPQLEVGEQYRLTLGKISRLKILKGRYSALIFDKDTVFLGITFSREDCELQIKTYHLLLEVESIKASSSTSKKDISIHNHHGIMAIDINREMMTRDWRGSHIYRNGALERIENDYGFWADSCYHYRIADYQGNVRAVISQNGVLERSSMS